MASTSLPKERTFIRAGQGNSSLYFITEGSVSAFRQGTQLTLRSGDIVGLMELGYSEHQFSYKTTTSTTLETISFSDFEDLSSLFTENLSFAKQCLLSSFQQLQGIYEQCALALDETDAVYQTCLFMESDYLSFCETYRLPKEDFLYCKELEPFSPSIGIPDGYFSFLKGMHKITSLYSEIFLKDSKALAGLLYKNTADANAILKISQEAMVYLQPLYDLFVSLDHKDYLGLYSNLLLQIGSYTKDTSKIQKNITQMLLQLERKVYPTSDDIQKKISEYKRIILKSLKKQNPHQNSDTLLADSLSTILDFSTLDFNEKSKIREKLEEYKKMKDPTSLNEDCILLRKEITYSFLKLYQNIVLKSVHEKEFPLPVSLFLHFGYLDEELSGSEYAQLLITHNQILTETQYNGVYTLYQWLLKIYNGEKEPSRNAFDEDYSEFLHSQKVAGKISEEKEREGLTNQEEKLLFELNNMFPNVNKMTYGRISTYCPIFSEHNIFKPLESSFVTPENIYKIFESTKLIDFQTFYRETLYSDIEHGINKIYIHKECLPDIILMPCVGTRGVMWQEIEGKKRTTPARMMLPIYQMEDLTTCLLGLFGEYRWEICKREMGARWNDVTEHSLTADYFDYLQFYKKNSEFTSEAKEKIRSNLQKCKNNFKKMFVNDYISWVLYESNGSPRLNKAARSILFQYCPFSLTKRKELLNNPLFKECIARYELKQKQKIRNLDNLTVKIKNAGQEIPQIIEQEKDFLNF